MKYWISKQNLDWLVNLWIRINGNKLARSAGLLIIAAIALSSSSIQLIITGAFSILGFQIPFPETPWWIIVFFVACATILLVVDRVLPAGVNPPNLRDISLFDEFQELITQSTRTFLHEHDFGTTWNNSRLEPIVTIANV